MTAAQAWLTEDANRQRGEFVLIVSGAAAEAPRGEGERILRLLLAEGLSVKQSARLAATLSGESKNDLYARALVLNPN